VERYFSIGVFSVMRVKRLAFAFFLIAVNYSVYGEKVLIYDEEKGIIFVDKEGDGGAQTKNGAVQNKAPAAPVERERPRPASDGRTVDASIQQGRHKDPPEVYFQSGLQYFKNGNFEDALKNFTRADSLDPQPTYVLWMGKALRQLHKEDRLLFFMNRIVTTYPESDVADDALFEIAFCHQTRNDYDKAIKTYTKLAEQFPFGTSYSNGESFRDLAHKQCQLMRADMISSLKLLGYRGNDLELLYREFQKSRGMTVSGIGDEETIKTIKAAYGDFLKLASAQARRQERMNKYRAAALALGVVLFINCIFLLVMNGKIAARRRQLASIDQVLSDLSMDAL
jgi:tetratricopeptide (TPR) repeat protein